MNHSQRVIKQAALCLLLTVAVPGIAVPQQTIPGSGANGKMTFAPIVKKVASSVVNVYSTKTVTSNPNLLPFFNNPIFRDFFGDEGGGSSRPRSRQEQSLGSGVIVTEDGYILTNFHVVENADEVQVVMTEGGREFTAKVVGSDPPTDLAVLKVNATGLPAAVLGDSDTSEIGDLVLAIGNPFSVGQTVTLGIISATGRGGFGITDYEDFIQTDAAINPGNSGGALVDLEGRVVGINTAILTTSRGGQGIGFAVPINLARNSMQQIIKQGRVIRGSLGVVIQELTPDLARQFKAPENQSGVLIGDVAPNGAAAKAGLKSGDIITAFDGKKVTDPRSLRLMVGEARPGTGVEIRVVREGKEQTFKATLGELPSTRQKAKAPPREAPAPQSDVLDGVTITDLDPKMREQLKIPKSVQGPVVVNVDPDSQAFNAGLRPGDVIEEINRQPIRNSQQAISISRKGDRDQVLLRVWSQGGSHYVSVDRTKKMRVPIGPGR